MGLSFWTVYCCKQDDHQQLSFSINWVFSMHLSQNPLFYVHCYDTINYMIDSIFISRQCRCQSTWSNAIYIAHSKCSFDWRLFLVILRKVMVVPIQTLHKIHPSDWICSVHVNRSQYWHNGIQQKGLLQSLYERHMVWAIDWSFSNPLCWEYMWGQTVDLYVAQIVVSSTRYHTQVPSKSQNSPVIDSRYQDH